MGALVHETSHAVLCVLTGAKIREFTVFAEQPRVVHDRSRLPFVGELLISAAPIAGGLLFLFLINRYLLGNYFVPPQVADWQDWRSVLVAPLRIVIADRSVAVAELGDGPFIVQCRSDVGAFHAGP